MRAVIFVRYPITRRRGNSAIFVSCVNQTNFIPAVKNIPWNILERHWAWTKLSCDLQSSVLLTRLHFLCWQRPCAWTLSQKYTNADVVCRCKNGLGEQNDSYFPAMLRAISIPRGHWEQSLPQVAQLCFAVFGLLSSVCRADNCKKTTQTQLNGC